VFRKRRKKKTLTDSMKIPKPYEYEIWDNRSLFTESSQR
jgi:hypothetical protein